MWCCQQGRSQTQRQGHAVIQKSSACWETPGIVTSCSATQWTCQSHYETSRGPHTDGAGRNDPLAAPTNQITSERSAQHLWAEPCGGKSGSVGEDTRVAAVDTHTAIHSWFLRVLTATISPPSVGKEAALPSHTSFLSICVFVF